MRHLWRAWTEIPAAWLALTASQGLDIDSTSEPLPSVMRMDPTPKIHMKVTSQLTLRGANFNPENTKLQFDPPLPEGTVLKQKVFSNSISLFKSDRYSTIERTQDLSGWAHQPGPLKVVAVDTGAGWVYLEPDDGGVVVAVVMGDVTVDDNKALRIYQSTEQIHVSGSYFENMGFGPGGSQRVGDLSLLTHFIDHGGYIITDRRSDQLTLNLAEGHVWIANFDRDRAKPAPLRMRVTPAFEDYGFGGKVATVFEDPGVDASDIEIQRTGTRQLVVRGRGFNKKVRPILEFDPPLDLAKLQLSVESSDVMYLRLSRLQPAWTPAGVVGPLKVKGIDTGAGMVVFDSPVTVATVVPNAADNQAGSSFFKSIWQWVTGENDPKETKISIAVVEPPARVRASSAVVLMRNTPLLTIHGANFSKENTTLYFDPPLPEGVAFEQQVASSSTRILLEKIRYSGLDEIRNRDSVWALEPGPLKVVAIDTGAGLERVNPEGGGVVVAVVKVDITVQDNASLHIYRSTKQVQVAGSGFDGDMIVQSAGGLFGGFRETNNFTVTDVRPDQLTLNLAEGRTWYESIDEVVFPAALPIQGVIATASRWHVFSGVVATVFEDPSIATSDIEIYRTRTHQLAIEGSGFPLGTLHPRLRFRESKTVRMALEFDPPIDPGDLIVDVTFLPAPFGEVDGGRNVIQLSLNASGTEPAWAPAGYSGPLKVKAIDTGAGMVVFDSPITVATVLSDSDAPQESILPATTAQANRPIAMKKRQEDDEEALLPAFTVPPEPPYVEPDGSAVSVLSMGTFDDFIGADFAAVYFYDPSLFHCKRVFREYTMASAELRGVDPAITLGEIDVSDDANKPVFERFDRPYLPAVKTFRNGFEVSEFSGFKDAPGIVNFVKAEKAKADGMGPPPKTPRKPAAPHSHVEPDNSEVSILPTADSFDEFIKADMAVVNFCFLECGACKRFFPEFTKASIELKRVDPTIKLGMVDTSSSDGRIPRRFPMSSWPTVKIFRGGLEARDFDGPRDAAGIIEYLTTEKAKPIDTVLAPLPYVEPSSEVVYMNATYILVNGAHFHRKRVTTLYFDPPFPVTRSETNWKGKVESTTQIRVDKVFNRDRTSLWPAEPGPLKIVAMDTGMGRVELNPEDGGVVIAMIQADVSSAHGTTVQDNDSLCVYQSTKQLRIAGTGFSDNTEVRFTNALRGGGTNFTISDARPDQLTLNLADGSTWIKEPSALPGALVMLAAKSSHGWVPLGPNPLKKHGREVATVFEDPSIDASAVEIHGGHAHELEITGTGFNKMVKPTFDFDPPLLPAAVGIEIDVVNRTTTRLRPLTSSGWTPRDGFLGALTIRGVDTGAGMVVFDSPVTVATFVPGLDTSGGGA